MAVMQHSYTVTRRPTLPPHAYLQFPLVWGVRALLVALLLAAVTMVATIIFGAQRVRALESDLTTAQMVYSYAKDNEEANATREGQLRETIVYVSQALREDNSPEALRALESLTAAALENDPSVRERKLAHAIETAWAALTIAENHKPLPAYVGHEGRG